MAEIQASKAFAGGVRLRKFDGLLAWASNPDGKRRFVPTLRGAVFSLTFLVAVLPIAAFYTWVEKSSYRRELASVQERHLILARNLSSTLSHYAADVKSVFSLAVDNFEHFGASVDFSRALANFHICRIMLLDADGREIGHLDSQASHADETPDPAMLQELRQAAVAADGQIVVTGIRQLAGHAHFFLLQALPQGRTAIAPLSPDYIIALQKSVAFGKLGHAMIVDQDGHVVAHPNAEWRQASRDASALPVVRAMMDGGTGVMQFYSPPMQADMIAGYSHVPETGWGVMVPQPISELAEQAGAVQSAALIVAIVQLSLAAALSWWLSAWLTRPIRSISQAAVRLSTGDFTARVGRMPPLTPMEIVQTATIFDEMVERIDHMTGRLQKALTRAQQVSGERARLLAAAQEANAVKSQFVSMVSHELRTPLTSIKGALELLDTSIAGDMPEHAKSLLSIAIRNGQRLARMIDDLLDLEKLGVGELRFEFVPVEIGDLVFEAVRENERYGALAGVQFRYELPEEPVTVSADPNRLMQVLANLLSNAAKFSNAGQFVDVSVTTVDGTAVIAVRDYGIGIPETAGESVFEAFVQIDSSDRRAVGGSGLGLSIARTIIARHDGTLSYNSQLGQGTVFTIALPLLIKENKK